MTEQFLLQNSWLVAISVITLPIKAYALWQSAKLSQKIWFVILFISNTFGILDILYILLVAKKHKTTSQNSPEQNQE